MPRRVVLLAICLLSASPLAAEYPPVSTAREVSLARQIVPEKATAFVFVRPESSLEAAFVRALRQRAGRRVAIREVHVRTGAEPLVAQYQVGTTPCALVYDRRGKFWGRSSDPDEIDRLVERAADVMRIGWADPGDPRYAEMERILGRPGNSGLFRTLSLRPALLKPVWELHRLRREGTAIDDRTRELVATYVSALNRCRFCVSAHADNLRKQGLAAADVDRVGTSAPEKAALTEKELGLLDYVKVLTLEPGRVRDAHVERLRRLGWTEQQIFEVTFEAAFMAFNNRMSSAWGLDYNPSRWVPPALRASPKATGDLSAKTRK